MLPPEAEAIASPSQALKQLILLELITAALISVGWDMICELVTEQLFESITIEVIIPPQIPFDTPVIVGVEDRLGSH